MIDMIASPPTPFESHCPHYPMAQHFGAWHNTLERSSNAKVSILDGWGEPCHGKSVRYDADHDAHDPDHDDHDDDGHNGHDDVHDDHDGIMTPIMMIMMMVIIMRMIMVTK